MRETLYDSVKQIRQIDNKTYHRITLAGYFNEQEVKRDSINIEAYLRDTLKTHKQLTGYLYIKGVFYIHILQANEVNLINDYLAKLHALLTKKSTLVNTLRILHQSYDNTVGYFRGWECDNNPQNGPILSQTQKSEEQIQDRSFEIYELFIDGAKKKKDSSTHKIGNMILLSNDDMSILISSHFMNLQEYIDLYVNDLDITRQTELNYPLPPSFFEVMEFLETQDYKKFALQ